MSDHQINLGSRNDLGSVCAFCGEASALRLDHIDMGSAENPTLNLNLELLCATCSTDKNARSSEAWLAALVQRFSGDGSLSAPDKCTPGHCKVLFPSAPEDLPAGWPQNIEGEVLWAQRLGPKLARIMNAPFTVKDLSFHDVVTLKDICIPEGVTDPCAAENYFQFESIAGHSGYGMIRVAFNEPTFELIDKVLRGARGSAYSWETGGGSCAFAVAQRVRLREMAQVLRGVTFPGFSIEILSSQPNE
jgi:hypothetical protein